MKEFENPFITLHTETSKEKYNKKKVNAFINATLTL